MGLIPLFIIALVDGRPARALAIFLIAGLTDALDGFIARFWGQQSHLGTYLDPMADKLLLVAAFVILAIPPAGGGLTIPVWVSVLVIARDVLIVVMCLVFYLAVHVTSFQPAMIGKVSTAVQLGTVVLVLLARIWPRITGVAVGAIYATALLAVASGLFYMFRASRMSEMKAQSPPTAQRRSPG
jgi:cardiolipin synthase